jgi:hypothetical protein
MKKILTLTVMVSVPLVQGQLLVSGENNCQSCLERVVSIHLIDWLFVDALLCKEPDFVLAHNLRGEILLDGYQKTRKQSVRH